MNREWSVFDFNSEKSKVWHVGQITLGHTCSMNVCNIFADSKRCLEEKIEAV